MLFILVMDILNCMVEKANSEGLLQQLATRNFHHRVSIYDDDVVLFLCPVATDLRMVEDLLQLFGSATGLKTNIQKSSVMPIQCSEDELTVMQAHLPCKVQSFPCKYHVLPLSISKLTRAQLQPIIVKIAEKLPGWKADLLNRAGRAILVQYVLTKMLLYVATALDLPPWCLKPLTKSEETFYGEVEKRRMEGIAY